MNTGVASTIATEYLVMDYGETLEFKKISFVLINKETFEHAQPYMISYMGGTKITLLDYSDTEVHVALERLTVQTEKLDTIADQTYRIEVGGQKGNKVKFQTEPGSNPVRQRILIVESWVESYGEITFIIPEDSLLYMHKLFL